MQIKSLRIKSYRSWHVNETVISEVAKERENKILLFNQLRVEGCSEKTALVAIESSRATFYRWKKQYTQKGSPNGVNLSRLNFLKPLIFNKKPR